MSDSLTVFGTDYTGVTGIKAKGTGNGTLTYIRPSGTKSISANGTGIDVAAYASVDVAVPSQDNTFVVTVSYNSTSEMWEPDCTWAEASAAYSAGKTFAINAAYTSGFVTADGNWDADDSALIYFVHQSTTISGTDTIHERFYSLGQSEVTEFDALDYIIPYGTTSITTNGTHDVTNYASASVNVPTGTARTSADLTVSGATVTAPAGLYSSAASASVSSGTAGTPTATKGSVSNHAVSVTPSVTNQTGYITGGTKTGTAVTVSASELVSGSETKTANGTYDVTNLAELVVNVASGGSASIDTKTVTASNYPTSISFTSMKGEPKAFFLRSTSQLSSSGSTTYYYIIDMVYDGNANHYCDGNCFRIGSTRRMDPITTAFSGDTLIGYTWSYSGTTLTITTSAASRSNTPGAFNNGYQLVYIY